MQWKGSDKAVGGTPVREGKAVPVARTCARLNGGVLKEVPVRENDHQAVIEMELAKGIHQLNAWFKDKEGKDNCAAYYVTIEFVR